MKIIGRYYSVSLKLVVITALFSSGCASVAVTNDAIEDRTAFASSLQESDFTVSNRVDDGVRSSYSVKTKSGKPYNCYVGGSISVIGRVVSDTICNEVGGTGSQGTSEQPTQATVTPYYKSCWEVLGFS